MLHRLLILLVALGFFSCSTSLKTIGNRHIKVFDNQHLYFDGALKDKAVEDNLYTLASGRILIRKIQLPNYEKQMEVKARIRLKSQGDPWDKAGSLFVLPASDYTLMDLEKGLIQKSDSLNFVGIKSFEWKGKAYQPPVELIRFMTPFGVGFFNDNKRVKELKPVYIPKWEDEVVWEQDITQLMPLLEGEAYVGVYIDTWTKEGYTLSVDLEVMESKIPKHARKQQAVLPLINTNNYVWIQSFYDAFARENLQFDIHIDKPLKNARLYYITTGHGGYAEGDEFNKKENILRLNGLEIMRYTPWRDDCASFRRFNPSSGVWTKKTTWKGEEIEERIASSDYSRTNWCPGSDVPPKIIDLGELAAGQHRFELEVPDATPVVGDKINFWMISAYIVYDKE